MVEAATVLGEHIPATPRRAFRGSAPKFFDINILPASD